MVTLCTTVINALTTLPVTRENSRVNKCIEITLELWMITEQLLLEPLFLIQQFYVSRFNLIVVLKFIFHRGNWTTLWCVHTRPKEHDFQEFLQRRWRPGDECIKGIPSKGWHFLPRREWLRPKRTYLLRRWRKQRTKRRTHHAETL